MAIFGNILPQKNPLNFICEICDFNTCNKKDYTRHLQTQKHIGNCWQSLATSKNPKKPKKTQHHCSCGKSYKDTSGLWKHKNKGKCIENINNSYEDDNINNISNDISDNKLIMLLLKQNTHLIEQTSELVKNGIQNTTNNTHTNSHNKTFNLQFFLNETCKEALNIQDFVSSIQLSLEDLENTGRRGYIEGISNIILKKLNNLEQYKRPIHCSDSKREILYIKDNDEWKKEEEDNTLLTNAIKVIANKNIKQINEFKKAYPDCTSSDSKKNNLYLKIVSNSMNGSTEEESNKNINKIISNVAKEVVIDKK